MTAKACWRVQAGVVPGKPMPEYTREYWYTSEHNEQDTKENPDGKDPAYHSLLAKMRAEALDYYLQVSMPQLNNWATIEFVWF